jgi:hypothetical protein
MDLIALVREKIDGLEKGEYSPGLHAVLLHIETAYRHLTRGRKEADETAFTDSIYRTNQAFEGSIKEAYRVLAEKDPDHMAPFDIETYLDKNNIFRARVLKHFKNYRTEWRNASSHDYKLDFDENEAFLAVVSVTAFSCLLLDEIAEKLAYLKSVAETEAQQELIKHPISLSGTNLISSVVEAMQEFSKFYGPPEELLRAPGSQIIGALHGFLTTTLPDVEITPQAQLDADHHHTLDLLIQRDNEAIAVEVKRRYTKKNWEDNFFQLKYYMLLNNIETGILLFLPENPGRLQAIERRVTIEGKISGNIVILKPMDEA